MITSSLSKPSLSAGVMLKGFSVAAVVAVGTFVAPAAHAVNIINGQVRGIWDYDYSGTGFNVGDEFTADYTYDSDSITTTDYSGPSYVRYLQSGAPLLSLVLKSGAITHAFDFWYGGYPYGGIMFQDIEFNDGSTGKDVTVWGYDSSESIAYFSANARKGQDVNGTPYDYSSAQALGRTGLFYYGLAESSSAASNVSITDTVPTAVPTPALLPGLVGMGVGVLRRRKQAKAEAVVD
jgi:hypothetical protein